MKEMNESIENFENDLIRIVVLPRGWVVIGRVFKEGSNVRICDAYVIRIWGTEHGLGQIAIDGPTKKTILDKATTMTTHERTVIYMLDVDQDKWKKSFI